MNGIIENLFFASFVLGLLISLALIFQVFALNKAGFFIGIMTLVLSFELLFSWGARSGYNNATGSFPIWMLLNYQVLAPSLWLFMRSLTDPNFRLRTWHYLLFVPALLELLIHLFFLGGSIDLVDHPAWVWFSEYFPLVGFILVLVFFWTIYLRSESWKSFKSQKKAWSKQLRFLALMGSLSLIGLLWLVFTFTGWKYFHIIELLLVSLFFGFTFLVFLENGAFPTVVKMDSKGEFPHYDDQKQLQRLDQALREKQLFLRPNLSLKELATELQLPRRYVSHLINRYHGKNYKGFINEFRIAAFLVKARSEKENHKTLLALALESGFNSKSTFNQVFKDQFGKTPSEYLG